MKKIFAIVMVIMLAVLSIVPVVSAGAEASIGTIYVDTDNGLTLNLRSEPSITNGSVKARLGVGKSLTLLSVLANGWLKVSTQLDGKKVTGYVMENYTSENDPTLAAQSFTKVNRFKVTVAPSNGAAGHVNLRAQANCSSTILNYLQKGDTLTVLAESHAFYQVRTANGATGYVVKAFVNK